MRKILQLIGLLLVVFGFSLTGWLSPKGPNLEYEAKSAFSDVAGSAIYKEEGYAIVAIGLAIFFFGRIFFRGNRLR